jgi:hypothetical protein
VRHCCSGSDAVAFHCAEALQTAVDARRNDCDASLIKSYLAWHLQSRARIGGYFATRGFNYYFRGLYRRCAENDASCVLMFCRAFFLVLGSRLLVTAATHRYRKRER